MMATKLVTDEEIKMKEIVAKTLESTGVLSSMRAQLRAAVYSVIYQQEEKHGIKRPFHEQCSSSPNMLMVELIREFLELNHLQHTLSVFVAEANIEHANRKGLLESLQHLHVPENRSISTLEALVNCHLRPSVSKDMDSKTEGNQSPFQEPQCHDEQPTKKGFSQVNDVEIVNEFDHEKVFLTKNEVEHEQDVEEEVEDKIEDKIEKVEDSPLDHLDYEKKRETSLGHGEKTLIHSNEQQIPRNAMEHEVSERESFSYKFNTLPSLAPLQKTPKLEVLSDSGISTISSNSQNPGDQSELDRLQSLDAKLKAMEEEDQTGTLMQLKNAYISGKSSTIQNLCSEILTTDIPATMKTLQKELEKQESKTMEEDEDEDEDDYGSDFEESIILSEEEILSESDSKSNLKSDKNEVKEQDYCVDGPSALDSYDYVEDVERP